MIEQSVSLASNGVVKVPGYEQMVRFGYTKNRGVYRLTVTATGEWEGLAIRCFWHVPDGKDPASSLVVDGYVDVPASVTAQPGSGCVTFEGSDGTKTVTSADLRYRVSANSGTEDGAEPEPGTPAWQQLVDAVHTDATAAEQAKTDAQTAAQQAVASAADAKATGDAISAVKDRQNILVGTETGNPLSVDDAFSAPLCGLTVYGRSTQDGTPTPDAPVPIVSAGDGGSVAVTLSDGNGKTQTLALPTPNGLPGIPVTSGGNYTDSTGQQWMCDEVDLERGVKVQRIYKVDIDGENVKFEQADVYANLVPRGLPIALYNNGQKIYATSTFTNLSWFYNTVNGQFLYLIAANLADQLNASCKKQLGKVYYVLATPIETPLTPDEIAAYKAITVYGPDTVVQAGDGAGIRLAYQRDVNIVVKNLEDAIASMTTT